MLHAFWDWWQFNFYLGLASLAAGIAVISPFLLNKSSRKRISRMDLDLEALGLVVLILAVVIVGLYNWFSAASSAA